MKKIIIYPDMKGLKTCIRTGAGKTKSLIATQGFGSRTDKPAVLVVYEKKSGA